MGFEQLDRLRLFLHRDHWGNVPLRSPLSVWWFISAALVGVAGVVLVLLGGGAALSWLGALLCAMFFVVFARLAAVSVDRRLARIERLVDEVEQDSRDEQTERDEEP